MIPISCHVWSENVGPLLCVWVGEDSEAGGDSNSTEQVLPRSRALNRERLAEFKSARANANHGTARLHL